MPLEGEFLDIRSFLDIKSVWATVMGVFFYIDLTYVYFGGGEGSIRVGIELMGKG